jgi:hypothetical protein
MSIRSIAIPVGCAILILVLLSAGCTSTTIGDVVYKNDTLDVSITNNGAQGDAFVQVTVYEIRNFHQQKWAVYQEPVILEHGLNRVIVPTTLPTGTYKLYVYVLKTDDRQTATIRDIVV